LARVNAGSKIVRSTAANFALSMIFSEKSVPAAGQSLPGLDPGSGAGFFGIMLYCSTERAHSFSQDLGRMGSFFPVEN
jgi:hypothetical protein